MLAHQLAVAHTAAHEAIDAATFESNAVERARLVTVGARMMEVFQTGLLTLQRLRTGGSQTIVVQRVTVSERGAGDGRSGPHRGEGQELSDYPMHCSPRCGARTRSGNPCQAPAIRGKSRCRMHGGKPPGRAVLHGRYTKAALAKKRTWRRRLRELNDLIEAIAKKL